MRIRQRQPQSIIWDQVCCCTTYAQQGTALQAEIRNTSRCGRYIRIVASNQALCKNWVKHVWSQQLPRKGRLPLPDVHLHPRRTYYYEKDSSNDCGNKWASYWRKWIHLVANGRLWRWPGWLHVGFGITCTREACRNIKWTDHFTRLIAGN